MRYPKARMRNDAEAWELRKHIRMQRGEVRKMQEWMDTLTDLGAWDDAARHLAELLDWIQYNEALYAIKRYGRTS